MRSSAPHCVICAAARPSSTLKKVSLEAGPQVQVPLFVEVGDVVRVDTRTGTYVTRV